ncbi:hypothetical protein GY45DRAFT_1368394 [Cubamyces sp. BRFM 1775]|nr:hypothetical protein GY45DRAFT_1368394 [Cubamyces sp. BRFM 1775]
MPPPQIQRALSAIQSMHAHMNASNNARPPLQNAGPSFVRQPTQNYPQQPQHPPEGYRHPPANPDAQNAHFEAHRRLSQAHAQHFQQAQQRRDPVPPPQQAFAPPHPQRLPQQGPSSSQARSVQAPATPQSLGAPPSSQPPSTNMPEMVTSRMTVEEAAAMRSRQILDSTHKSVYDALNKAHQNVAQELKTLHTELLKRDAALRDVHARFAKLSKDYAHVQARRQEAEKQCAQLKAEKERAEADAAKMSEHLPKFLAEFCEVRAERARLAAELDALREAGGPLKNEMPMVMEDMSPSLSPDEEDKLPVKTEVPYPVPVKREWKAEASPALSMADHDATIARALAEAHEERKRRQRIEHELEVMKGVLTVAKVIKASGSPNNVPEALPFILAPQDEPATAAELDSSTADTADQSADVSRPPSTKVESQGDSLPFWMIPGSELIDLTSVDDSPMQFSGDFMGDQERAESERKRGLDADAHAAQESQPALKRQKTLDSVPSQAQLAEEGSMAGNTPAVTSDESLPRIDAAQDAAMSGGSLGSNSTTQRAEALLCKPASSSSTTSAPSQPSAPAALSGLSLPSQSTAVQLPGQPQEQDSAQRQLPTPTSPTTPKRLSMLHMPLVFETIGNTLQCRLCKRRRAELGTPLYILDKDTANWDQTAGHCEREHPAARNVLVTLGPTEIMEQRLRLEARSPLATLKVRA